MFSVMSSNDLLVLSCSAAFAIMQSIVAGFLRACFFSRKPNWCCASDNQVPKSSRPISSCNVSSNLTLKQAPESPTKLGQSCSGSFRSRRSFLLVCFPSSFPQSPSHMTYTDIPKCLKIARGRSRLFFPKQGMTVIPRLSRSHFFDLA